MKYLGINLAKDIKVLYNKNCEYCWEKLKKI